MRAQLVGLLAVAMIFGALFLLVRRTPEPLREVSTTAAEAAVQPVSSLRLAAPARHAYLGVYAEFGEDEDEVTLEAIEHFDELVGKRQALVGFANDWGKQYFPREQLKIIANYGAVPLVYWLPWDRAGESPVVENRFSLPRILQGEWDNYLDRWADGAKDYGGPMLVAWGLEMNGNWFPWSGVFYGGGAPAPEGFTGVTTFIRAYRYVVDRVRARGVRNIQWVFHANNRSDPELPWNAMAAYYPGADYADWLALSAYGMQYPHIGWARFDDVLPGPYRELAAIDETKPLMLAEWGIGEFPRAGSKARWIGEFFRRFAREFPRLRAAVFWHERWQNGDLSYSNLRVNSSPEALAAYRLGIRPPFWLERPFFESGR